MEHMLERIANALENLDANKQTIQLSTDDYNNIAWIGEQLHELNKTLTRIADNMEAGQ
jgi:hypothetical protein